ncbi:PREDICTED: multidrug resistance protein 1A-like, partial [Amphimedon queenslandica]|uniref:Uncharacterized protein n=1 Tax=Amphimedon queenslandica TaxID=400682 RepID=A0AAN0IMB0_AMPQE
MSEGDLEKAPPPSKEEQIELDEVKIKDDSPPVVQTDDTVDVETKPKTVKRPWWKKKEKEGDDEDAIPPATLKEVFSFATPIDCFFMITAILAAFTLGCALPGAMLVFGDLVNAFINQQFTQYAVDTVSGLNVTSYMQNNTIVYSSSSPGFSCEVYSNAIETYATIGDPLTCVPFSNFSTSLPTSPLTLNINPVQCSALAAIVTLFFGTESSCTTDDEFINSINIYCYYFIGLAVAAILIGYYIEAVFQVTAERQIYKIRLAYYKSVMKQDIAWFDVNASGEVASRLVDDLDKVQTGIGEKCVILFQWIGSLICGFTIGFVRDWRLTLALLSITPFLAVGGALMAIVTTRFTSAEQKAYATAGALAEEVLSSIKTVIAFGGEYKESDRYTSHLKSARSAGIKKGLGLGLSLGYVFFLIFSAYAIAFWFGGYLISEGLTQGGQVLTVFFCVFIAAFSIGQAGPYMEALSTALGAAGAIFDVIKKEPPIDSSSTEGIVLEESEPATIHLKDVNFSYPTRPDVQVLKSFSLSVDVGQTVALVGHSGCGKSTIVQLLQRFYDIEEGEIKIASHSIKDLNIASLHDAIGVVSQEPVLFDTTILDNIRYAKDGATQEEIEAAAKTANVHQFISELPDGYNTLVGEGGTQLSGGQKQRIAIARALIRNPKILLLDEATSALDSESESLVQSALEKASLERTTIVIAHRLSTIRNADLIVCLDNGEIKETGTHDELMKLEGLYYDMVTSQTQGAIDDAYLSIEQESSAETKGPAVLPLSKQYSKQVSRQFSRQASTSEDKKDKKTRTEMLKKKQEEWDKDLPEVSLGRIMKLNAKEWWLLALGVLGASVQGSIFPVFAIIFGEALKAFSAEQDQVLNEVHLPAGLFLALAFVSALAVFFKTFCFAISGEKLTSRIRSITFKAMLRKDMSWFDEEKNSTGALTTRLAEDAALIQGATGLRLATLIETLISLLFALGIALAYSWIMTIIILGFAPFLVIVGAARAVFYRQHLLKNKGAFAHAGQLVVDSLENIRTVTALNLQNKFAELYEMEIRKPYKTSMLFHHIEGVAYGMSQGMIFFGYALAFR